MRIIARDDGMCLLAVAGNEAVGYLAGYVRDKSSYRLVKTAELESMFVKESFRFCYFYYFCQIYKNMVFYTGCTIPSGHIPITIKEMICF
jgi:hypothetical protein